MTCSHIESRLPAYREDLLSPEERKIIAEHLASCPYCSRSLAGLEKAEQLLHGLGEVEPPPFFEQRIMSRVREEAGKKQGILRRLFYPLHIKVPIQALTALLIAVLTFHVYQSGDPEMKAMAPLPAPLTDPGKDRIAAEAPKTLPSPSLAAPVKGAPAGEGDLPETNRQRFAATPSGEAAKPPEPVMTATGKEPSPADSEGLSGRGDRAEKKDAAKSFETPAPQQKRQARMSDTVAGVRESANMTSTPSPARMTSAAPTSRRPVIDLTIRVGDSGVAIREIEARLGRVNARIFERQDRKGSEFIKAEMPAGNVAALLELLEAIGRVNLETGSPAFSEGDVTIGIKIVAHP